MRSMRSTSTVVIFGTSPRRSPCWPGGDAPTAELEELGKLLVPEAGEVSIVGEERHEMTEDVEVVLHQVQVAVPPEAVPEDELERKEFCKRLVTLAEIWA